MKPVFLYCEECQEQHWVPEPLASLPDPQARLDKIGSLWAAGDISEADYEHWRHVILMTWPGGANDRNAG